jgi:hypothetical protein
LGWLNWHRQKRLDRLRRNRELKLSEFGVTARPDGAKDLSRDAGKE